jgi:hypothetical protein
VLSSKLLKYLIVALTSMVKPSLSLARMSSHQDVLAFAVYPTRLLGCLGARLGLTFGNREGVGFSRS